MSMQSTGQAGGHSAQPMHQFSTTVCIRPCAPTIASTGHASMQRAQPMQRASSMRAAFSRFIGSHAFSNETWSAIHQARVELHERGPGFELRACVRAAHDAAYADQRNLASE